ncbi:MAG TPA: DUF4878 domain-containing protein [Chitinophagaceae bacterium]|jgi:hypothetical protein|nr:DUF4878 domain-containing protein [Chitinophagaceae bacterium]HMU57377.1 DUF4878 domain-containing protein [Chitinophagaceae bacterium]
MMKKKIFSIVAICFSIVFVSCSNNDKKATAVSDNNIDAARNFIRAALDGKFTEAKRYMLDDSLNNYFMNLAERSYIKYDQATRTSYLNASIQFHKTIPVNDSVSVIIYSNSYKNDHDTLKVIKSGQNWLIDLKYLFLHDSDTTLPGITIKDTLR